MKMTCAVVAAVMLAGCASTSHRPVLYPNAKLNQVGDAGSQRDVDDCIAMAERAGASAGSGSAARSGLTGAAVGGAASAVASAIFGGNVLNNAAAGAAIGGTAGAVGGAMNDRGASNSAYQNYVGRCLRDRGYDVMGWQ
jgi:outer membrane lipoprotein SlyB